MNKLLVSIYIAKIDEEFNINVPIGVKVNELINIIQDTICDLTAGNYVPNDKALLYRYDGSVINVNNFVGFSGITNGVKLMLI